MPKQIDIKSDGTPVVTGIVNAALSLTSSEEPGKVKIDADTGVMSVNNSYSTTEQMTGQQWIDGKPIYRRVFTGNVTGAKDTRIGVALFPAGIVDALVDFGGSTQLGGTAAWYSVPMYSLSSPDKAWSSHLSQGSDGSVFFYTLSGADVDRTGTTSNAYRVWVEYTKA
jgi:hypothetical protein